MKILWLAPYPYPSPDTHPAPWITSMLNLISEGNEITILTYSSILKEKKEIVNISNNVKLIFIKSPRPIIDVFTLYSIRLRRMKQAFKKLSEFDVIHVHGTEHQYEYVVKNQKNKVIISIQGIMNVCKYYIPSSFLKKRLFFEIASYFERKSVCQFSNYMCRTTFDTNFVRSLNKKSNIYNVWEVMREEFYLNKISSNSKDIYFTGGTNVFKNLSDAFKLISFVKIEIPNVKLHVLGNCDENIINRLFADNHTLNKNDVVLHGMCDAGTIIDIMKMSFLHFHPSLIDNSPNSICESQMVGLPVIAYGCGGVPSLINHGEDGFLVSNVLEALEYVLKLQNNLLWDSISKKSRKMALERHNRESIRDQTLEIYKEISSNV